MIDSDYRFAESAVKRREAWQLFSKYLHSLWLWSRLWLARKISFRELLARFHLETWVHWDTATWQERRTGSFLLNTSDDQPAYKDYLTRNP